MRVFEALLLGLNVLALLLSFRKWSLLVWSSVVGINLLILLVHSAFEGIRFQMAFSYFFVVLLVISWVTQAPNARRWVTVPKVLTVLSRGFAAVLLAVTAFLAYALPVFTLPTPSGQFAVGVRYLHLVDEKRNDPFLDTSTQKRELMVKVYYPAVPDDTKPFARYFAGSTKLTHALAAFYQMPPFVFDHLTLVTTFAKDNLAVSDEQAHYPVVVFSHGAGATMEVETAQSEDLASHGYIVATVDHPFISAATVFPDRIVRAQEATRQFDTPEPAEPLTQIMADDDAFVIDMFGEMNDGRRASPFTGRLDMDKVGVIGHSVGGAAAYNLANNDRRIKAAINLDGVVYITPKNPNGIAPFLMLANDQYHVQAIKHRENLMQRFDITAEGQQALRDIYGSVEAYHGAYAKAQQNIIGLAAVLERSGNLYTIGGSDHMKFTDIGLFIGSKWLRELLQIRGETDPARCLAITQALTVAFFDQHLKGQSVNGVVSVLKRYGELQQVQLR